MTASKAIDIYSRVTFAKLYTSKHAITSADILNDRVLPFFEQQQIPVLRMLTDRGTEFNGRPENHEYELFATLIDPVWHRQRLFHSLREPSLRPSADVQFHR